jgi:SNF2 family DNA or RNA helicase
MEFLRVKARVRDPMLIVAPLTTLGHWRREIETWTTMNCICYMGGKDDRVVRPPVPPLSLLLVLLAVFLVCQQNGGSMEIRMLHGLKHVDEV